MSDEKDVGSMAWEEHYERGVQWCKEEAEWLLKLIDPHWGRPARNEARITISDVARRCGTSDLPVWRQLHSKKPTVRMWWLVRWAVNRNVSGHATYEDWSRDNGAQLRDLCVTRFGSVSGACAALDLPNSFWRITRGDHKSLKIYAACCLALGVAMPARKRNEKVELFGKLDDKLTSPPLWNIEIPRGLLSANMSTDHIQAWLLLPTRSTPRSIANALGLHAGYVSTLLLEMERRGIITGEGNSLDYIRRYRRNEVVPVSEQF